MARLAQAWRLDLRPALLGDPYCSFALAGEQAGTAIVLKVPILGEERSTGYRAALAFAGHGGVPVLDHDAASGSLLMPHLGGPDLGTLAAADALDTWCALHEELGSVATATTDAGAFLDLKAFVTLPDAPPPGIGAREHADIVALRAQLLATSPPARLLHGDLHHFNVLAHAGRWYAIDPKGLVGDPHFEAAALLRNPFLSLLGAPDLEALLAARIRHVAARTGLDAERLRAWGLVQTCACAYGPAGDWQRAMLRVVAALGGRL